MLTYHCVWCYDFYIGVGAYSVADPNRTSHKTIWYKERRMMNLTIPREILQWVNESRGSTSQQVFIIKCLAKLKEIDEMKKK